MTTLTSFTLATILASTNLGILAMATRGLGAKHETWKTMALALAVALKLGLLVGGTVWLAKQPGVSKKALMVGLLAPFALFVMYQGLKLQTQFGRRS